jgi:hypothetical protein
MIKQVFIMYLQRVALPQQISPEDGQNATAALLARHSARDN